MNTKGQSTVEFILLVTAVVAVILFLTTGNKPTFQTTLNGTIRNTVIGMETMGRELTAEIAVN